MQYRLPPEIVAEDFFDPDHLFAPGNARACDLNAEASRALVPNRPMPRVEWAESRLRVSNKTSVQSGPLRLTPMQKGPVAASQERGVDAIAFMAVPRIRKTTAGVVVVLNVAGHEGDDVIIMERSETACQVLNDSVLVPFMEASPAFRGLMRTGKRSGETEDKWMDRVLNNGAAIRIRSAANEGSFRQIKGRILLICEAGDPIWSRGAEGDKIDAALKRVQNYVDGRIFMESSPTEVGSCAISEWWEKSDKRMFFVPCLDCGAYQVLHPHVGEKEGPGLKYTVDHKTKRIVDCWYQCENCGEPIRETDKRKIFELGEWKATEPNPKRPGTVGFHLWAIHSLDPKSSWMRICEQHLIQRHDPTKRQSFKNLWLGLPWERHNVGAIEVGVLEQRIENYPAPCPDGVRLVTAGIDTQDGNGYDEEAGGRVRRHEVTFCGWGYGEECWQLGHFIVEGDNFTPETSAKLIELLKRDWRKRDGTVLRTAGVCVDVGFGMLEGLRFVNSREVRQSGLRMWAVRGKSEAPGRRAKFVSESVTGRHKQSSHTYLEVGTQAAKDTLERRKRIISGPEAIHIPASYMKTKTERSGLYDWFKSFAAISKRFTEKENKPYWVDKKVNEAIDCWIYAYAALTLLKDRYSDVRRAVTQEPDEPSEAYDGEDYSAQSDAEMDGITYVDVRPVTVARPAPSIPAEIAAQSSRSQTRLPSGARKLAVSRGGWMSGY